MWQNSYRTQALIIVDYTCATAHGNCRGTNRVERKTLTDIDSATLNKRKTTHLKYVAQNLEKLVIYFIS